MGELLRDTPPPRLTARLVLFLALTAILLWPALYAGAPLYVDDTRSYYRGGGVALDMVQRKIGLEEPKPAAASAPSSASVREAKTSGATPLLGVRSVFFSVFTNLTMRVFGIFGPVVILAMVTAALMIAFVAQLPWRIQIFATTATASFTMLPYYTSQLSPDIFAGHLILSAMILLARTNLSAWGTWLLIAIIYFSIVAHYAHIPLGLAVCGFLFLVLFWRGKRAWALAAASPVVLALATNIAISLMIPAGAPAPATEETTEAVPQTDPAPAAAPRISVAPARFPILLARSLEDGPARRYLEDVCPDAPYAMCEIYDEFPTNAGAALWGPDAIYKRATVEQAKRVANEETELLWEAFKAYPLLQVAATLRNTWYQFIRIGFPPVYHGPVRLDGPRDLVLEGQDYEETFEDGSEYVQLACLALAIVSFLIASPHLRSDYWTVVLLVLMALAVNALVCGGLSAPVNRYQGRVIWCAVLLGFAVWGLRSRGVRPGAVS